jgi:adenylate cyclase
MQRRVNSNLKWPWVVAGLLVFVFILGKTLPVLRLAENWTIDWRTVNVAEKTGINNDIVFVSITEDLLSKLTYRSPVDRGVLSASLGFLERAKPKAVLVDLLFDQPTELKKDRALHDLLANYSVPIVVATASKDEGLSDDQIRFLRKFLTGVKIARANLVSDTVDGKVRWLPGKSHFDSPGMSARIADLVGVKVPEFRFRIAYRVPLDSEQGIFRTFPLHMVQFLPEGWFTDKIVIVGADLPHSDRHASPLDVGTETTTKIAGPLIHAHGIAQLLDGRFYVEPDPLSEMLLFIALSIAGVGLAVLRWPWFIKLVFGCVVVVGYIGFNSFLFMKFDMLLPIILPLSGVLFAFFFCTVALEYQARQQRQFIRDAFSQYISKGIVDHLLANPEQLVLGGEVREVTYLFTDLAGFTALTEKTEPTVLVAVLNEYLDGMCTILFRHNGMLDKIVGDAVVAFFNAPVDQVGHGALAVDCALEMDEFAEKFRKQKNAEGIDLGITRIGVHSGPAIVGNFGGAQIVDYTSQGDTVNTAARLESVNKHLGTRLCVSEASKAFCSDVTFRPVGGLVLKGKVDAIEAFEPISENSFNEKWFTDYRAAFDLLSSDEIAAKEAFQAFCDDYPNDPLAKFHLRRLGTGEKGSKIIMDAK